MSSRPQRPRPISRYEVRVLRRVLDVGIFGDCPRPAPESLDRLIVVEEGKGGFLHDSLDFGCDGRDNLIMAAAVGRMSSDGKVEITVWADGNDITYLQLDPFHGAPFPARMPILGTIEPYPPDAYGADEDWPVPGDLPGT